MAIFILILLFYIYGNQPTSMKPSDNLYLLIKSLTGNEKRYFKVFAKRHISSRQSKYEQLFDVYDSLGDDEYDESDLKKKLQKKGLGKNLADDKKNLQEMVTKSLVSFHAGQSVELSDLLAADDLYRQKRLNSLRQKTIARAREIAERYDKFSVLLTLADRETTMRMEQDQESLAGIADTIGTEQKVLLHKMSTMYDLVSLHNWLFIQYRLDAKKNSAKFREVVEQKMSHPTFTSYKLGLSFNTDRIYYSILGVYYLLRKNTAAYNNYVRLQYELYEKQYPHQKDNFRLLYNISLYNYLYSLHTIRNFSEMKQLLDQAATVIPLNEDEAGESFQNLAFYRQLYYMNTFKFDEAIKMVGEIEDGILQYRKKINTARKLALYSNIAIAYMMTEQWEQVADYTEKIISEKTAVRLDIKHEAMMHQLIARYELKQYDLLSYQARSVQRTLSAQGHLSDSQAHIIRLINRLNKDGKDYLLTLKRSADKTIRACSEYSGIEIWLYSRIHAVKMIRAAEAIEATHAVPADV
jgi:hypothetical protein